MSANMKPTNLIRRDWLLAALGGMAATTVSAQTAKPTAESAAKPALAASAATPARPRIGLALGGGSARGFAHIGVLKSLDQAGIRPDVIAGTSAGSLVGAFYAAGWTPWQIEEFALAVREADVADFSTAGKRGMLAGDALARIINDKLKGARLEGLKTRFAAVCTDLKTGELALLRQGLVGDAVRASCSIPGVFVPKDLNGRELVDGGLVSPLPVRSVRQMGADLVIAVDVAARPKRSEFPGLYEVILQSFEIMGRALADQEALQADLVIRPETSQYSSADFNVRREMIQAGYEAAQAMLPELKRRLEGAPRAKRSAKG
jgi:NTE family protein